MPTSSATQASRSDYDKAIATLVAAFVADPVIRWMMPDARQYFEYFPQVLKHFAGGAFAHGSAWRSEDFRGTALWLPPGVGPDEEALGGLVAEAVAGPRQEEVFAVLEQVGGSHPPEPHWYLPAIGVDPTCQGRGYGSALLARSLEACDAQHQVAYLESTNPANIPLYERHGFEIVGEIQAGSSPVLTRMLRPAR